MAITDRQTLIHLHTSGTTPVAANKIELGEIAVQHNTAEPALLIKDNDGNIVKFVPKSAIETEYATSANVVTAINAVETSLDGRIDALEEGYHKSLKINEVSANTSNSAITITISSDDIKLGTMVEYSGTTLADTDATITEAIQALANKVDENEDAVAAAIEGVHTHANSAVLDTITSEKVSNWDTAAASAHTHENQDLLDSYTQTEADLASAVASAHNHTNSTVLDALTAEEVAAWNASAHTHANKTELDKIADGDKAVWDAAATSAANATAAIEVLNGDSATTGSVAKSVADAISGLNLDNTYAAKSVVDTLIGSDANKSVRTIANEELAAQLIAEDADASLDTLQEIAAWIQEHPQDAAAMNSAITGLENSAHTHANSSVLDTITSEKVAAWDLAGSSAHTHANSSVLDALTAEEVAAWNASAHTHANGAVLDGITAEKVAAWDEGEANKIETVKVNGSALTITDKAVDIDLSEYAKNGDAEALVAAESARSETAYYSKASGETDHQAIETLNGDSATTGSVAKSVADAIAALDFSEDFDEKGAADSAETAAKAYASAYTDTALESYATSADTHNAIANAVDGLVSDASGDTYVSATVEDGTVKVSATQGTKDSLALADSSLQGIATGKESGVSVDSDNKLDFSLLSINCGEY